MTPILVALLIAVLAPFFMSGWRAHLAALGAQGVLMGWLALSRDTPHGHAVASALELFLARGLIAPYLLSQAMLVQESERGDEIPPSMLTWTVVAALVAVAFAFAGKLEPSAGDARTALAVAAAGLLLGLFTLAHQPGVFSQAAAALRVENAIALFELTHERPAVPVAVEAGLLAVFLATAVLYAHYVRRLAGARPEPAAESGAEELVL